MLTSGDSPGYFSQGLNELFQNIYGVELVVETPEEGELWDSEVTKLAVRDSDNLLGYIYCDFFRRKGKPFQDCHFTCNFQASVNQLSLLLIIVLYCIVIACEARTSGDALHGRTQHRPLGVQVEGSQVEKSQSDGSDGEDV